MIVPAEFDDVFIYKNSSSDIAYNYPVDGCTVLGTINGVKQTVLYDTNLKKLFQTSGYLFYQEASNMFTHCVEDATGNDQYGILDTKGEEVLPPEYDHVSHSEHFISFSKDGIEGAIDLNGNVVVPLSKKYVKIANGGEGMFMVQNANKNWGYWYDKEEVIPCIYSKVAPFNNGVAMVIINEEAKQIANPKSAAKVAIVQSSPDAKFVKTVAGKAVSRYPKADSDIDTDIPSAKPNDNRFAFIVANENYDVAPVPYALNDGRTFAEYCQTALGVPQSHTHIYEDATLGNIISAISKLKNTANAYDGDAEIIFYYAGHGIPNENGESAYLLPIDGNPSDISTTGYNLSNLYKELAEIKTRYVMMFLDACFSGAKREDEILLAGRGVRIKIKEHHPVGNLIVFSASTGDETAHQLEEKRHGLFTYHLLKAIKESDAKVTLGEIADIVTRQVKRQSVVINQKRQTPTIIPSPSMTQTWREIMIH